MLGKQGNKGLTLINGAGPNPWTSKTMTCRKNKFKVSHFFIRKMARKITLSTIPDSSPVVTSEVWYIPSGGRVRVPCPFNP